MVASGSRTMIAGSLFSYIVGFLLSCRFSQLSGPRRSCVGTEPAFAATGVGSHARGEGDRRSTRNCARGSGGWVWRIRFGVRHVFTANCSSSGLRSRSRASPGTWSNDGRRPARAGGPSCITTRRTFPPWTFVVPTIRFDLLYAFVIVRLGRRELVWINVTAIPTAEWVARQITEACPWDGAARYMISGIAIGSMAPSSDADCEPWAFGTNRLHRPHAGRMALPNG